MRLNFQVQGHGRPLVILHGFLGSSDNWRSMSRRLSSHFTVYCLDLRNHGQSPHSDAMDYPIMAADLREFVEKQSLAQVFLLGHSMGGKVAMQFAGQYPERVDKLVVVDIAPKAYPPTHQSLLAALHAVDLRAAKNFSDIDSALRGPIPEAEVRQFLMKNLTRSSDHGFQWRIGLDAILQNYNALIQAVVVERPFSKPACFIRAGRSNFVTDQDSALIRKAFPQAKIETIARAGHWVHIDAADEFYQTVTGFLTAPDN
jgi:esterase